MDVAISNPTQSDQELLVARDGEVVRLTLNRPQRRNALSRALIARLDAELDKIGQDPRIRVVVIAAAGPVFCSGHDLSEMPSHEEEEYRAIFGACSQLMLRFRRLPQPVIARVQGLATAAGCQLAAACDVVVAAETAAFATPGVKIGLFCTTPMVPLVRAIPAKPAMEMLLTGEPITARRAYELGLVNRVVPAEQLDATVQELADAIIKTSPHVIALGKAEFYAELSLDEAAAYARATQVIAGNAAHRDAQEGFTAFLERRTPTWSSEP